jgi:hypothetical protein
VIGQVLDYAKEFSRWNYDDLVDAVRKTSKSPWAGLPVDGLQEAVRRENEDLDEAAFHEFNDKLNFARSYPDLTRGRGMLEFAQQAAAVHIASFDGLLTAWYNKTIYDAVRPWTAIGFVYGDRKVRAWGGPGRDNVLIPANQWRSYVQTSDHSEYPSGTTTFCASQTEVGRLWLGGSDSTTASYTWEPGSGYSEPGLVPAEKRTITWNSWSSYLADCVNSRTFAGVHFPAAAEAGAVNGKKVAKAAYDFVKSHIAGQRVQIES